MHSVNRRKILVTLAYYTSFIAMGISMSSLGPTLPELAENTRAGLSAISILFTARALGSLAGSVGGGQVYDRMSGNRIMALMIVLMALLTALTPVVSVLWLLAGVLFITGAVQGILNIGGNNLLVWLHGREVGPFMNGLHFCFGVGTFITPVIVAQFVVLENGLLWTYLLLALLILPTAAVALLPSPSLPESHLADGSQRADGSRRVDPILILLISAVFGCYSGASLAYGGLITSYALEMNLADAKTAAYLTSIYWGALSLSRLVAIPLAVRFKPQTILQADFAGAFLSLLVLFLWPRSMTALIITSAGLGFALASIYPTTMTLSGQMMAITGRITGLFSIGNSAGAMLLPWIIGQFFESAGPQSLSVVLLVDMVVAMGVLMALGRRSRPQTVSQAE